MKIAQLPTCALPFRNYDVIMKAQIIQIGNSQGIRIPKMMLEETRLPQRLSSEVHPEGLLIKSLQKPRCTWDAEFKAMAETDRRPDSSNRIGDKVRGEGVEMVSRF
jgi:antitoxin MazE